MQDVSPASHQHSAADVSPKKAQRGAKRAAGPARAKQPAKRSKTAAQHVEGDEGASQQPSTPDIKGKGPAAKAAKREQEAQHAAPIQDKLPDSVEAEERKTVHINRAPVLTLWVRAKGAMQSTPACLVRLQGQCSPSAPLPMLSAGGRAWCTCSLSACLATRSGVSSRWGPATLAQCRLWHSSSATSELSSWHMSHR